MWFGAGSIAVYIYPVLKKMLTVFILSARSLYNTFCCNGSCFLKFGSLDHVYLSQDIELSIELLAPLIGLYTRHIICSNDNFRGFSDKKVKKWSSALFKDK